MFPAKLESLQVLRRFVEAFCADAKVGEDDCLRLNLVLEELFTNTICHGHRGDSEAPVWVTLGTAIGRLDLTYEDSAPPFNPYGGSPDKSPDVTMKLRKAGGLGVVLIRKLAPTREYAYLYGRNRIRLAFELD